MRLGRREQPRTRPCPECGAEAPRRSATWCGQCGAALRPTTQLAHGAVEEAPDAVADPAPRRDVGRVLAAVGIVAIMGTLLVTQAADDTSLIPAGYTARGDAARTGIVSHAEVPEPDGIAWTAQVAVPPQVVEGTQVLGSTHLTDGREVVVTFAPSEAGQRITVHGAMNGTLLWTTMLPLGSQPWDTDLDYGLVAHRTLDEVSLLDLTTRERRWTVPVRLSRASAVTPAGVVGAPVDATAPALVLLDAQDGSERWRWDSDQPGVVTDVHAVPGGVLVDLSRRDGDDHELVRLDLATGAVVWRLDLTGVVRRGVFPVAPLDVDGDDVLIAGADRTVVLDARDGTVRPGLVPDGFWPLGGTLRDGLAVLHGGEGEVVAVDEDGLRWRSPLGRSPLLDVAVGGDVVAVRGDADVALFSADDGGLLDRLLLPSTALGQLSLTDAGTVMIVHPDGTLEAYGHGGTRWRVETVTEHLPDMATDAGAVAITTPSGVEVRAVADGIRRWSHDAFDDELVTTGSLTAPVLRDGLVAFAPAVGQPAARGGLTGLVADTGIVDWARRDDALPVRGSSVPAGDELVVPVGTQLHGYERDTGRRATVLETEAARSDLAVSGDTVVAIDRPLDVGDVWGGRLSTRERLFRVVVRACAPPTIVGELLLVLNDVGEVFGRSLGDGEGVWGERVPGSVCRPFSVAGDTAVVLVDDRTLVGIDLVGGDTTWTAELGATASAAPVVAGETLLVPTLAGVLEAWQVGDDEPRWTVELDGIAGASVAVDGDTILVLRRDGVLLGLR